MQAARSGVTAYPSARAPRGAAALLGFALGGFFDGIVLHQVLQWHHLLSGLDAPGVADIRVQILADGLFHVLMYVLLAIALWRLWRARGSLAAAGAGRALVAWALIGFGIWHVVDAVLFHWVLGLHRIRMGVSNPLAYDLGWLIVFGAPALLAGWWLLRRSAPGPGGGRGGAVAAGLAAIAVAGGIGAAWPVTGSAPTLTVVLLPGAAPARAFDIAGANGAGVLWSSADGQVWVLDAREVRTPPLAFSRGALVLGGRGLPPGCFAWLREA